MKGNIGSGKSTFLTKLGEKLENHSINVDLYFEPEDEWQEHNLLTNATKYPTVFAFPLQTLVMLSLFRQRANIKTQKGPAVSLFERGIETSHKVFLEVFKKESKITDCESNILDIVFTILSQTKKIPKIDLVIYLKSSPEDCLKQITKRGGGADSEITIDYLQALSMQYDKYIADIFPQKKVIILENNHDTDFEKLCEEAAQLVALKLFIKSGVPSKSI